MLKVTTNNNLNPTTPLKWKFKKTWIQPIILSFTLLMLIISCVRIPYIGQFFDSVIFSFLFGYAKYLIYLYAIAFVGLKLFRVNWKPFYAKRMILFIFLASCSLSLCLGGIEILRNNYSELFNFYIHNVWYDTIWNFDSIFVFGYPDYFDGGLIGASFGNVAGLFIILFSIIFALTCYFILFRKQWEWCKAKVIGHRNKRNKYTSNKVSEHRFIGFKKMSNHKPVHGQYLGDMIKLKKNESFDFSDCAVKNTIDLKNEIAILSDFFTDNNINITSITSSEDTYNYSLDVKTTTEEYKKIYAQKDVLKLIGLANDYHLVISDEMLKIDYPKSINTLNLSLINFLKSSLENPLDYPFCLYDYASNAPTRRNVLLNLQNNAFYGIFDPYKHNTNIINILILAISINYAKNNVLISYINPLNDFQIVSTDLCNPMQLLNLDDTKTFITRITKHVNETYAKINDAGVANVYEYNNHQKNTIKTHMIIINNIDYIKQEDIILYNEILALKENASMVGISLVCIDNSSRSITYEDANYPLIVGFYMDVDASKAIFDSNVASSLEKVNNLCIYSSIKNYQIKGYIPNLNDKEIKILQTKFLQAEK